MGLEGFDPFHTMHYEQSQSAHVKWLEILEGRADDPPPRRYEVLIVEFSGAVFQERKKLDGTFNFRHTFWAASSTSAARGGWCVFVAPSEKRVL